MSHDMVNTAPMSAEVLRSLIVGMRAAYARGENAMEYARQVSRHGQNIEVATLIAYDLQAGSYIRGAVENPTDKDFWCSQLAELLNPFINEGSSVLEVGCGEATTLAGVSQKLNCTTETLGFDISWSRCAHGLTWLAKKNVHAELFVANLFNIPLGDSSVDVVYTSHSLEPNGGREEEAIKELLRVARRAVVLVEPIYELAHSAAQDRMRSHGYVKNLKHIAEGLSARVTNYRLLDYCVNRLNPSGVITIEKDDEGMSGNPIVKWRCPLTYSPLSAGDTGFFSSSTGIVYPVVSSIPLLRAEHAIIASAFDVVDIDTLE